MSRKNVYLICRSCGALASLPLASLPLGMTCNNHLPVPTPPDGWLLCLTCRGAGEMAYHHDYATEWLACPDCQGVGSIECAAEGHWTAVYDEDAICVLHDPDDGPCEYPNGGAA